jgi:regulator of sigma E protease
VLGSIPAGGYVSLPQMATMETIEGKTESGGTPLPPITALDKIIVAFAGPLFSFLLALAFAVIVMTVGRPVSKSEMTTTVGYVLKDGPAHQAGIQPGDKILEVDNKPVKKFQGMGESVTWRIVRSEGAAVSIKVLRDGEVMVFHPRPGIEKTRAWQRKNLRKIQIAQAARQRSDERGGGIIPSWRKPMQSMITVRHAWSGLRRNRRPTRHDGSPSGGRRGRW